MAEEDGEGGYIRAGQGLVVQLSPPHGVGAGVKSCG
jgi:hypothetical protein